MNALIDNDPEDSRRRELREKINAAKAKLPLPQLMDLLDDEEHAHASACCPFHEDEHPSFSIYQTDDGNWLWHCFAGCGGGDEIDYLATRDELEIADAIQEFLRLAEDYGDTNENNEQDNDDNDN